MGTHKDEFFPRSADTQVRVEGDRDTHRPGGVSRQMSPPWKEGEQLNDFVLEKLLGRGSSGFVYRALDTVTGRRFALKLLLPGTPEDLVRNKLGLRRMMPMRHPNLVRVDRIHQLGEFIALSMEEVVGETLAIEIRAYRKLDPMPAYEQLMRLTRDYASALAALHGRGYVHRDIKPHNLMVDSTGTGRVIDYGLVGTYDAGSDSNGFRQYLVGTPKYFSPETLWDQHYLPAGDIFSLGVVMLEALHSVSNTSSVSAGVERSEANRGIDAEKISEAIEGLDESVPDVLREACLEMLLPSPGDRPTAMQVARLGLPKTAAVMWVDQQPMVGRDHELAEICAWLKSIVDGDAGRLHLSGVSGIGKTRLIDAVEQHLLTQRWCQVFRARCRPREDQPLQAFDQLCDAIATRYMKNDREAIDLDPVSATILHNTFPALKNVVQASMVMAPAASTSERLDALEAVSRLSAELRKVGPLILIVDDIQWADRDSLNVLDRLQSDSSGMLGMITVSRTDQNDRQRLPANRTLDLQPIPKSAAITMLSEAADRWSLEISDAMLVDLAAASGGNPLRLVELTEEFRPGGALSNLRSSDADAPFSELARLDPLWELRVQRLSQDARQVLPLIVTAGRPVSTQQLGELTGLKDSVDVAVSELVQQRLVTDEATGGECITMVHDRVSDELINTLGAEEIRQAHIAWANLLVRQDQPAKLAARIAGHLFDSDQPGRAVSYAILAAEVAERLVAKTEAARWHERVLPYVSGEELVERLRQTARCFNEADHPVKAARYYQQLAHLVDHHKRIEYQLLAVALLIRSGRFSLVRDQLANLAKELRVPRPKPSPVSTISLWLSGMRLATRRSLLLQGKTTDRVKVSARHQQRLKLCLSLVRPLWMFDCLYAAELNVAGAMLAIDHGDRNQRSHAAIGAAVFACYDGGAKRVQGETLLQEFRPHLMNHGDAQAIGDLWSGIALSHALACRWNQVCEPVKTSVASYRAIPDPHSFEIAHARWLELWASWNLGRWDVLSQTSEEMVDDSIRRSDLFQSVVTSTGLGGSAWLARDDVDGLRRLRGANRRPHPHARMQMLDVFEWVAETHCLMYEGRWDDAWSYLCATEPHLMRLPYSKIQLIRVLRSMFAALIALQQIQASTSDRFSGSSKWARRAKKRIRDLARERVPYANAVAGLYQGLLQRQLGHEQSARENLARARGEAQSLQLIPFELAAADALAEIETGRSHHLLRDRMRTQHVSCPHRFERLYTVADSR